MSSLRSTQQSLERPLSILMVTGIYPTERNPHSGTFIKTQVDSLVATGMRVEVICPRPGPILLRYLSASLQVYFKTLTRQFDIVHGHYGQWCLFARMQWNTPVVISFLGSDLLGAVSQDGHMTTKGALVRHLSRWLCHHVDAVTVKTEEMKKATGSSDIIVYSDGIDFDLFRPIQRVQARIALGWDPERYYILFGNNPQRPVKNYPLAQAAVACLRDKGIEAELVVASGLTQSTVVQYINASNALILTSITEGSPNIVKEAMACNVPVVSTEVGDVAQVTGQTEGCSVCANEPEALACGLERALRHEGPTTGRVDIQHLERSVIARQVIAVYEQVLRNKQAHQQGAAGERNEEVHAQRS
jgi:teichuronic acid biosynthesis glycosyltransferase TuaC